MIGLLKAVGVFGWFAFCAMLPTAIALGVLLPPGDWLAHLSAFPWIAALLCAMAIVLLLPWMLLSLWLMRREKRLPASGYFALAAGSVLLMSVVVELPYVVPRLGRLSALLQRDDVWQQTASYAQTALTLCGVAGLTAAAMHLFRRQLKMGWMS